MAAESSAAILHQGLARATWPPLPETAQAALKTHSFILMHRFTYSCILNRSTNGHNWIHYWVIRALSHCLCSVTWCCGNAQEEQTGQRHGQWQGLQKSIKLLLWQLKQNFWQELLYVENCKLLHLLKTLVMSPKGRWRKDRKNGSFQRLLQQEPKTVCLQIYSYGKP